MHVTVRRQSPRTKVVHRRRPGFTLVELLVVIVIIGLLMGLVVAAIGPAVRKGRNAAIKVEMDQIGTALKEYKNQQGSFPPCFASYDSGAPTLPYQPQIVRHVRASFPRYLANSQLTPYQSIRYDIMEATKDLSRTSGRDIDHLDPAEAIVFWLGGLPVSRTLASGGVGNELTGFSADPARPFLPAETNTALASSTLVQVQRLKKFFPFDQTRLTDYDADGWPEYIPQAPPPSAGEMPPFVYFDAVTYNAATSPTNPILFYGYPTPSGTRPYYGSGTQPWGVCLPWTRSPGVAPVKWMQAEDFQLICAGLDGVFETAGAPTVPKHFPEQINAQNEERDNLSNFAESTWEDAIP